jgi:ribosomal-protein-alanine N-acetyltransferase
MDTATYETRRLILRPLTADDFTPRYLAWFRNLEVTQFLDARNISRADAIRHLEDGKPDRWFLFAVLSKQTGEHIGNVKIGPINWSDRVSDLVTVIGESAYWGQGLATEAIKLAMGIAFNVHGMRKLAASIVSGNDGSVKAYTRAGFEIEGVLKGHYLRDGKVCDKILIGAWPK